MQKKEYGAVSLFVVIFAALLISVVTVGFIRLMLADQQQASSSDLSQSAYDSAQAGVEDAKRALLRYQTICATGDVNACKTAYDEISSQECNKGLKSVVSLADTETEVQVQQQQSGNDKELNQAYTCVTIQPETDDYIGTLSPNASNIIPLRSKDTVTSVVVEWYSSENMTNKTFAVNLLPNAQAQSFPLFSQTNTDASDGWGPNRPSIMRTQLMQFGSNFTLSSFDNTVNNDESNTNTLFLYPTGTSGIAGSVPNQLSFTDKDARLTPGGAPVPVSCSGSLAGGGFACTVNLALPTPIGESAADPLKRTAYLRLSALYNASNYRVTLYDGATPRKFDAVQPQIDSTGRANDLFRRVVSRVELIGANFNSPETAVDVTGSLCKNFAVTDDAADYNTINIGNTCQP